MLEDPIHDILQQRTGVHQGWSGSNMVYVEESAVTSTLTDCGAAKWRDGMTSRVLVWSAEGGAVDKDDNRSSSYYAVDRLFECE